MDKDTKYYAIDISKDVFEVTDSESHYYQFLNTHKGFNKFVKLLNETSYCVKEATGYYHYQLAYFLQENGVAVLIENPLSVKRFIQVKLSKIKADKSDSRMICEYAQKMDLKL